MSLGIVLGEGRTSVPGCSVGGGRGDVTGHSVGEGELVSLGVE